MQEVICVTFADFLQKIGLSYTTFWGILAFAMSIGIEIIPKIKWSPWSALFLWIGGKINDKIDKKVLRPMPKVRNGWKPNLRTKEGKEFKADFSAKAEEWEVTENALHEFGIHMADFNRGVSHYIRPMYDSERNRYFLLCSDSIPQTFDKARTQTADTSSNKATGSISSTATSVKTKTMISALPSSNLSSESK